MAAAWVGVDPLRDVAAGTNLSQSYLLELTGFRVRAEYEDFKGSPPRYG